MVKSIWKVVEFVHILVKERILVSDLKDSKHLGFFREKKGLESQGAGLESFFPRIILQREKGRDVL